MENKEGTPVTFDGIIHVRDGGGVQTRSASREREHEEFRASLRAVVADVEETGRRHRRSASREEDHEREREREGERLSPVSEAGPPPIVQHIHVVPAWMWILTNIAMLIVYLAWSFLGVRTAVSDCRAAAVARDQRLFSALNLGAAQE